MHDAEFSSVSLYLGFKKFNTIRPYFGRDIYGNVFRAIPCDNFLSDFLPLRDQTPIYYSAASQS